MGENEESGEKKNAINFLCRNVDAISQNHYIPLERKHLQHAAMVPRFLADFEARREIVGGCQEWMAP